VLLLRNASTLTTDHRIALKELLHANRPLSVVYLLRDELKALWQYRYVAYAERLWRQWYNRAIRSKIDPLKRFARRLKSYVPGILAHCTYPLGTNLIEGINDRVKVIKRVAYGSRGDHYFFPKIRAAFPGNG
jgi:transposase